jgi:hypothetical protein
VILEEFCFNSMNANDHAACAPVPATSTGRVVSAAFAARWLKIKNPDYSQKEGRGDLLNRRKCGEPTPVTRSQRQCVKAEWG